MHVREATLYEADKAFSVGRPTRGALKSRIEISGKYSFSALPLPHSYLAPYHTLHHVSPHKGPSMHQALSKQHLPVVSCNFTLSPRPEKQSALRWAQLQPWPGKATSLSPTRHYSTPRRILVRKTRIGPKNYHNYQDILYARYDTSSRIRQGTRYGLARVLDVESPGCGRLP